MLLNERHSKQRLPSCQYLSSWCIHFPRSPSYCCYLVLLLEIRTFIFPVCTISQSPKFFAHFQQFQKLKSQKFLGETYSQTPRRLTCPFSPPPPSPTRVSPSPLQTVTRAAKWTWTGLARSERQTDRQRQKDRHRQ